MKNNGTPDEWMTLEVTPPHEMLDAIADFRHEHGSGRVVMENEKPSSARIKAYLLPKISPAKAPASAALKGFSGKSAASLSSQQ